jgi:hypothetical protein
VPSLMRAIKIVDLWGHLSKIEIDNAIDHRSNPFMVRPLRIEYENEF